MKIEQLKEKGSKVIIYGLYMNETSHTWMKHHMAFKDRSQNQIRSRQKSNISLYVLHFDIWADVLMHRFIHTQSGSHKHSLRLIKRAEQLPVDWARVHKSHIIGHKHSDDIIKLFPISAL